MGLSERELAVRQRRVFLHTPAATFSVIYEPYLYLFVQYFGRYEEDFVNSLESSVIHKTLLNNSETFLMHFGDVSEAPRRCARPQDIALDTKIESTHAHSK